MCRSEWRCMVGEREKGDLSLVASGCFATMLKRRQKSSPFSPREGRRVSSASLRRMGRGVAWSEEGAKEMAGLAGRAKTGVIGVSGAWRGCGELGEGVVRGGSGERLGSEKGFVGEGRGARWVGLGRSEERRVGKECA